MTSSGRQLVTAMRLVFGVISDILVRLPLQTEPQAIPPITFYYDAMLLKDRHYLVNILYRAIVGHLEPGLVRIKPGSVNAGQSAYLVRRFLRHGLINALQAETEPGQKSGIHSFSMRGHLKLLLFRQETAE